MTSKGGIGQPKDQQQPGGEQPNSLAFMSLSNLVSFWRKELPGKFGLQYGLNQVYQPSASCNICGGTRIYQPEDPAQEIPCICQIQDYYQKKFVRWQDYNFLPPRYQQLEREDILGIERRSTPVRRTQFLVALKAIDFFIEIPQGNLILVGAAGTGRSMLAAYISKQLVIPSIFISLRQLIDLLTGSRDEDKLHIRELFHTIPVLIIDEFSAPFDQLDAAVAQSLHDLVYNRRSEMLPIVLVSNIEPEELGALLDPLMDYLQQDGEIIAFDSKHIQISRAAAASTRTRPPHPVAVRVQCCPWLRSEDGSSAPTVFPAPVNYCLRTTTPQPVALAHQASACLSEYTNCPVFQAVDGQIVETLPDPILRKERRAYTRRTYSLRERLISWLAIIGIATGLAALVGILFGAQIKNIAFGVTTEPSSSETPIASLLPTLPPTNTVAPATFTATIKPPTETPTIALTPTVSTPVRPHYVMQVSLARVTNLRRGPNTDSAVVELLPAGTRLNVLGRDTLGIWVRVDTTTGLSGWIVVIQIAETIDVLTLPIYVDAAPTPMPSATTVDSTETATQLTPTATQAIPESFNIVLQALDISTCSYPDITSEYVFRLAENRLSISRPIDGTVLTGNYNPNDGTFRVSATHDVGLESMNGKIVMNGGVIEISGEQNITYFDGTCAALFSVSGHTSVGSIPQPT